MSCCLNDEGPSVFDEQWRVARKRHRCCECGDYILTGMEYQYIRGMWDGMWDSYKTCALCADLRDSLTNVVCVTLGGLSECYTDYIAHGANTIMNVSEGTHAAKLVPDYLVDQQKGEGRVDLS